MGFDEGAIPFTSSDVWVFLAVAYAGKPNPATLSQIVSTGDMINKAVFTPQELRRGLAKLIAVGFIQEKDLRFSTTSKGQEFLADSGAQLRSVYDRWHLIEQKLRATRNTIQDSPTYEDQAWSYPRVTDELVAEACQQHSDDVQEVMRVWKTKPS